MIRAIASRFHAVVSKLKNAQRRSSKTHLLVNDEYDVQYLLEAILELFFKNVRPEEWTPSYLGGSSRVDFLLSEFQIVIEVKLVSDKLKDKELGKQLMEDILHYNVMSECKTLICFIYNPDGKLKNPSVIKADLEKKTVTDIDDVIALIEPH
ncbi:hypothetical protein KY385_02925 [Candidatus Parcubacteria bacterium]|nr:hypothetical protein [Candidatus Parcubacteria bacterium]